MIDNDHSNGNTSSPFVALPTDATRERRLTKVYRNSPPTICDLDVPQTPPAATVDDRRVGNCGERQGETGVACPPRVGNETTRARDRASPPSTIDEPDAHQA